MSKFSDQKKSLDDSLASGMIDATQYEQAIRKLYKWHGLTYPKEVKLPVPGAPPAEIPAPPESWQMSALKAAGGDVWESLKNLPRHVQEGLYSGAKKTVEPITSTVMGTMEQAAADIPAVEKAMRVGAAVFQPFMGAKAGVAKGLSEGEMKAPISEGGKGLLKGVKYGLADVLSGGIDVGADLYKQATTWKKRTPEVQSDIEEQATALADISKKALGIRTPEERAENDALYRNWWGSPIGQLLGDPEEYKWLDDAANLLALPATAFLKIPFAKVSAADIVEPALARRGFLGEAKAADIFAADDINAALREPVIARGEAAKADVLARADRAAAQGMPAPPESVAAVLKDIDARTAKDLPSWREQRMVEKWYLREHANTQWAAEMEALAKAKGKKVLEQPLIPEYRPAEPPPPISRSFYELDSTRTPDPGEVVTPYVNRADKTVHTITADPEYIRAVYEGSNDIPTFTARLLERPEEHPFEGMMRSVKAGRKSFWDDYITRMQEPPIIKKGGKEYIDTQKTHVEVQVFQKQFKEDGSPMRAKRVLSETFTPDEFVQGSKDLWQQATEAAPGLGLDARDLVVKFKRAPAKPLKKFGPREVNVAFKQFKKAVADGAMPLAEQYAEKVRQRAMIEVRAITRKLEKYGPQKPKAPEPGVVPPEQWIDMVNEAPKEVPPAAGAKVLSYDDYDAMVDAKIESLMKEGKTFEQASNHPEVERLEKIRGEIGAKELDQSYGEILNNVANVTGNKEEAAAVLRDVYAVDPKGVAPQYFASQLPERLASKYDSERLMNYVVRDWLKKNNYDENVLNPLVSAWKQSKIDQTVAELKGRAAAIHRAIMSYFQGPEMLPGGRKALPAAAKMPAPPDFRTAIETKLEPWIRETEAMPRARTEGGFAPYDVKKPAKISKATLKQSDVAEAVLIHEAAHKWRSTFNLEHENKLTPELSAWVDKYAPKYRDYRGGGEYAKNRFKQRRWAEERYVEAVSYLHNPALSGKWPMERFGKLSQAARDELVSIIKEDFGMNAKAEPPAPKPAPPVELRHYTEASLPKGIPTKPDANGLVWFTEGESYVGGKHVKINIPADKILRLEESPELMREYLGKYKERSKANEMKFAEEKGFLAVKRGNDVAMRPEAAQKFAPITPAPVGRPPKPTSPIPAMLQKRLGELNAMLADLPARKPTLHAAQATFKRGVGEIAAFDELGAQVKEGLTLDEMQAKQRYQERVPPLSEKSGIQDPLAPIAAHLAAIAEKDPTALQWPGLPWFWKDRVASDLLSGRTLFQTGGLTDKLTGGRVISPGSKDVMMSMRRTHGGIHYEVRARDVLRDELHPQVDAINKLVPEAEQPFFWALADQNFARIVEIIDDPSVPLADKQVLQKMYDRYKNGAEDLTTALRFHDEFTKKAADAFGLEPWQRISSYFSHYSTKDGRISALREKAKKINDISIEEGRPLTKEEVGAIKDLVDQAELVDRYSPEGILMDEVTYRQLPKNVKAGSMKERLEKLADYSTDYAGVMHSYINIMTNAKMENGILKVIQGEAKYFDIPTKGKDSWVPYFRDLIRACRTGDFMPADAAMQLWVDKHLPTVGKIPVLRMMVEPGRRPATVMVNALKEWQTISKMAYKLDTAALNMFQNMFTLLHFGAKDTLRGIRHLDDPVVVNARKAIGLEHEVYTYELKAIREGGLVKKLVHSPVELGLFLFQRAERTIRQIAHSTAYLRARDIIRDQIETGASKKAADTILLESFMPELPGAIERGAKGMEDWTNKVAGYASDRTMFDLTATGKPLRASSSLMGSMAYHLRSYTMNFWVSVFKDMKPRQLAKLIAYMAYIGGPAAIPLLSDIVDMSQTVKDKVKEMAEKPVYGIPWNMRQMFGWDFSDVSTSISPLYGNSWYEKMYSMVGPEFGALLTRGTNFALQHFPPRTPAAVRGAKIEAGEMTYLQEPWMFPNIKGLPSFQIAPAGPVAGPAALRAGFASKSMLGGFKVPIGTPQMPHFPWQKDERNWTPIADLIPGPPETLIPLWPLPGTVAARDLEYTQSLSGPTRTRFGTVKAPQGSIKNRFEFEAGIMPPPPESEMGYSIKNQRLQHEALIDAVDRDTLTRLADAHLPPDALAMEMNKARVENGLEAADPKDLMTKAAGWYKNAYQKERNQWPGALSGVEKKYFDKLAKTDPGQLAEFAPYLELSKQDALQKEGARRLAAGERFEFVDKDLQILGKFSGLPNFQLKSTMFDKSFYKVKYEAYALLKSNLDDGMPPEEAAQKAVALIMQTKRMKNLSASSILATQKLISAWMKTFDLMGGPMNEQDVQQQFVNAPGKLSP